MIVDGASGVPLPIDAQLVPLDLVCLTVGSSGWCASQSDLCSRSGSLAAGPARRRSGPVGIESMLVAPRFAEDLDTVAVLSEPVDEGDDAGGARKRGPHCLNTGWSR